MIQPVVISQYFSNFTVGGHQDLILLDVCRLERKKVILVCFYSSQLLKMYACIPFLNATFHTLPQAGDMNEANNLGFAYIKCKQPFLEGCDKMLSKN